MHHNEIQTTFKLKLHHMLCVRTGTLMYTQNWEVQVKHYRTIVALQRCSTHIFITIVNSETIGFRCELFRCLLKYYASLQ